MTALFSSLILTTGIILAPELGNNGNEEAAFKALVKATYKEAKIDEQVKRLEEKHLPKFIRENGIYVIPLVKIVQEQKITYEWRF